MLIGRFNDIKQTDSRILMAIWLSVFRLCWMTIWKVDLGFEGGLPSPTAHWPADHT